MILLPGKRFPVEKKIVPRKLNASSDLRRDLASGATRDDPRVQDGRLCIPRANGRSGDPAGDPRLLDEALSRETTWI